MIIYLGEKVGNVVDRRVGERLLQGYSFSNILILNHFESVTYFRTRTKQNLVLSFMDES